MKTTKAREVRRHEAALRHRRGEAAPDGTIVEPFGGRPGWTPTLRLRKHRGTTSVEWNDAGVWYDGFEQALDSDGMDAALAEVWRRHCHPPRACFSHGGSNGCLTGVSHEAGIEAFEIVRAYYSRALRALAVSRREEEAKAASRRSSVSLP